MVKVSLHILSDTGVTNADGFPKVGCKFFFDRIRIVLLECPAQVFQFWKVFPGLCLKPFLDLFLKYPLDLPVWYGQFCHTFVIRLLLCQITCRKRILFVRRHQAVQVIPAYAFRQMDAVNSRRAV